MRARMESLPTSAIVVYGSISYRHFQSFIVMVEDELAGVVTTGEHGDEDITCSDGDHPTHIRKCHLPIVHRNLQTLKWRKRSEGHCFVVY